jgi:glutamate racemase
MNKIVLTDSGLGGISILASLYEEIRNQSIKSSLDLIFVNALPETGKGYNTMPDIPTKIKIFNRVLDGIENFFKPDLIGIACNTLSVIANQTNYAAKHHDKIIGIAESGVESFLKSELINNHSKIIIFGTETTIEMDTHRLMLINSGISRELIIPQVCSGLASAIEDDPAGMKTKRIIDESVRGAVHNLKDQEKPILLYLACTHFGYVKTLFEDSLKKEGFTQSKAFDPNHSMVNQLYRLIKSIPRTINQNNSRIKISIYSRCKIRDQEITSIAQLLSSHSPETTSALTNYTVIPELFIPF